MSQKDHKSNALLDEEILSAIAAAIEPRPPEATRNHAMRERILARVREPAPPGTRTVRAGEGSWQVVAPLIEMKVLHRDEQQQTQTALYRLGPGARLEAHRHAVDEECLVLEGEIRCGDHSVVEGDFHLARAGCVHPPIHTTAGALLLVREAIRDLPAARPHL